MKHKVVPQFTKYLIKVRKKVKTAQKISSLKIFVISDFLSQKIDKLTKQTNLNIYSFDTSYSIRNKKQ